ncbi:sigma-70 family RNA polymerase sigma factor [Streptomyces sp. NPDC004539]|uniref:sigma-70 family RNA polymerase sigma factor n=1 Tax=Streptomyces sp. NPDC004539 TaxID=3154280 RepID=UPI0033BCA8A4
MNPGKHTKRRLPPRSGHRKASRVHDDTRTTALALAARDGDPVAGEAWTRALYRDVLRYVVHLGADPQAADDVVQDTFLRALTALHRFEGRSSARSWLLAIARHAVVDSHRRRAAQDPPRESAEAGAGFEEGVVLGELLGLLPPERREAFVLTQLAGWSYEEVARRADCPVGTVRSRVARARTALAEQVRGG